LELTDRGRDVLFGRRSFAFIRTPPGGEKKACKGRARAVRAQAEEDDLFEVLRALRKELAKEHGVPPFVVFSDRTLRGLARAKPMTPTEMRKVSGVGAVKLRVYGEDFLNLIRQYVKTGG